MEGYVIGVLILILVFTIDKTIKYYRKKELFKLVSWSVIGDYNPVLGNYSYTSELMSAINNAQSGNKIDSKYKIAEDDIESVREIVQEFQTYMARLYFRDNLQLIKSKYVVSNTDYFMASLFVYLSNNSLEREFLGHDMFGERVEYKRFNDGSGYSATDTLSDYGYLFYKLFHITCTYCQSSTALKGIVVAPWAEERIKKALETKQIEIIGGQIVIFLLCVSNFQTVHIKSPLIRKQERRIST